MKLLKKIYNFIDSEKLIKKNDKILVAVSGGKDSVFLLNALIQLKDKLFIKKIGVIHINHNLRNGDSDEDELFVETLAEKMNLDYFSESPDIKQMAVEEKMSLEAAGRRERYKYFKEYAEQNNYDKIATAHTKNDQVETLLMRIFKGTGLKGFRGIPKIRGKIIRPILNISTEEILDYVKKHEIEYREDYTNVMNTYDRNKIRNEIIPLVEEINPNFSDSILTFKSIIEDARNYIQDSVKKIVDNHFYISKGIHILEINKIDKNILREVIYYIFDKSFNMTLSSQKINDIVDLYEKNKSGKYISISEKIRVHYNYGKIFITNPLDFFIEDEFDINLGENVINKYKVKIFVEETEKIPTKIKNNEIFIPKSIAHINDLTIRTRKHGDVFIPKRTGSHRKIKKYFNDIKLPRVYRDKVLLLSDNEKIFSILEIENSIHVNNRNMGPYFRIEYNFEEKGGGYEFDAAIVR